MKAREPLIRSGQRLREPKRSARKALFLRMALALRKKSNAADERLGRA